MCALLDINELASYQETLSSPNSKEWIAAMQDQMDSIMKNQVWELVDLPPEYRTIRNKWVLKVKCKANGSIDKFKVHLVVKGYI